MRNKKFTADFETLVNPHETRVWAVGLCEIGNTENFQYGDSIEYFINFCRNKKANYLIYFHNLKFDGEFIIHYLLSNGFTCIKDKKDRADNTFTTLISDTGQFYSIEIFFETQNKRKINKVTIYDSLKVLNFSVAQVAESFNLGLIKGEIDYKKDRPLGYVMTAEEIEYLKNDVTIMAKALTIMFTQNLTKMTIGSNALGQYKEMNQNFRLYFPVLPYDIDAQIRESYKGGFTYLNPYYKGKEVKQGSVYDANSLYPSIMYNENLPIGEPLYFEGCYELDRLYPLYVQKLTCAFRLKPTKIPSIQIKNNMSFLPNEYIETSDDELITLTLTNIDLALFFEQYDVYDIVYHGGWKFKQLKGLFKQYIDKYTEMKTMAKQEKNSALYLIAKLMLNSLYGKFGSNPNVRGKYPILNEDGIIKYKLYPNEIKDSNYIPVASFITSYARQKTIITSQLIRDYSLKFYGEDYYIYSDTDSIHCLKLKKDELMNLIDIDDYKLGAWKHEGDFIKAKFLRQKCYIEQMKGEETINVTVSGMPKRLGHKVNFDNFNETFSTDGKLTYKHVKGGVILEDTTFTIKV